jgi:hypothetical protein
MKLRPFLCLAAFMIITLSIASCTGSDSGNRGSIALMLTDDPAPEYKAVYVTIHQVQVHRPDAPENQWMTVITPDATFNLLELVNGSADPIGVAYLDPGTYTQMRLLLGTAPDSETNILGHPHPYANYIVTAVNGERELTIPGSFTTGIKIVHTLEIVPGLMNDVVLDFDAARSIVKPGNSGKSLLKPVIKVIDTAENATVNGEIAGQASGSLSGVHVSAQIYNPSAATEAGKVTISASTITDEGGGYQMYLEPGTYLIVAAAEGYSTAYAQLVVNYKMSYTQDLTLSESPPGTVSLKLTLPSARNEDTAAIELRQTTAGGDPQQLTVKSVNYSESGTYSVSIPSNGTYKIIAQYGGQVKTYSNVHQGDAVNINFPAQ